MDSETQRKTGNYSVRTRLPHLFRYSAIAALVIVVAIVIIGFYKAKTRTPFKLKGEHTQLSTDVVAEVENYERLETENGVSKYYVKADHAKTFSDNHQELDNAYIETYDDNGQKADVLKADRVLYVPEEEKNFTAYLNGNVDIQTRDQLHVKTQNVTYTKGTDTAEADEAIEFERGGVKGRSVGANIQIASKKVDLLKDVNIEIGGQQTGAAAAVQHAVVRAGSASYDQAANKVELDGEVSIKADTRVDGAIDLAAGRAVIMLTSESSSVETVAARSFELFDAAHVVISGGGYPSNIDAGYAMYDTASERFDLRDAVHITSASDDRPIDIKAGAAIFERAALKLQLSGGAEITQGQEYLTGDTLNADLFSDHAVRSAVLRGNGVVRQTTQDGTSTISAPELNADFNEQRQLVNANAIGLSVAQMVPSKSDEYSQVTMTAPDAIAAAFNAAGGIQKMRTVGRTVIQFVVPDHGIDSANKRVTADAITTDFSGDGKSISAAAAVGNAQLDVEPLHTNDLNYNTTINAPRLDCAFYPTGNRVRQCTAGKKARAVRTPTQHSGQRGVQTLTADQMKADFDPEGRTIQNFYASGSAKFSELDRSVSAGNISFSETDLIVRLRGGEPTAADANSRGKAREIDWDTRNKKTFLRGNASTTYFNRKKIGDAVPFASSERPVYVTADSGEVDHAAETAVFTGNAKGWQDNNYVRADRLYIDQKQGKLVAEGNVQSQVNDVKQMIRGKESRGALYATSRSLTYDREARILQFRDNVDIRQGTDRLTAGAADLFLDERNAVARTVVQNNVVVTQPGRRASGDWAEFTAADETAILRGNPASVTDAENGSSQSSEISFNSRENKVSVEGRSRQTPGGRIRTVYKVKP
ncbi:MAG: LPS export ABC transporter periplasmic protein LptC [Acidobacteria bacterium]|nr:LPS export ABC transporter periplasmic protein LptC [Acidobacteriota bacterium]